MQLSKNAEHFCAISIKPVKPHFWTDENEEISSKIRSKLLVIQSESHAMLNKPCYGLNMQQNG